MKSDSYPSAAPSPPRQFFMSLYDIGFWIRSARADTRLARLQKEHGTQKAFDLLYAETADPWGYTVPRYRYQRLKYQKMLELLPARPYASALDVGCGLGVFTRLLAPYVQQAVGVELSAVAVEQAHKLSVDFANLTFRQGCLLSLSNVPDQRYDLVVLADVLYYLDPLTDEILASIIALMEQLLQPGGILMIANHFFFTLDPQSRRVRQIHDAFSRSKSLALIQERRAPFFLTSIYQRESGT